MKKTLFTENAFGQVYWYSFKPKKFEDGKFVGLGEEQVIFSIKLNENVNVPEEHVTSARRFMYTQRYNSIELFKAELEKWMLNGVKGTFRLVKHSFNNTFSLEYYRAMSKEQRAEYARKHGHATTSATSNQSKALPRGESSYFF